MAGAKAFVASDFASFEPELRRLLQPDYALLEEAVAEPLPVGVEVRLEP